MKIMLKKDIKNYEKKMQEFDTLQSNCFWLQENLDSKVIVIEELQKKISSLEEELEKVVGERDFLLKDLVVEKDKYQKYVQKKINEKRSSERKWLLGEFGD